MLEIQTHNPVRITSDSADRFIAACRHATEPRVHAVAADLIAQGFARPYQIAERLGVAETIVITAIQRGRLPAIGRGWWLFVAPGDAERWDASIARKQAA
jgi:hypothetical protein